MSIRSRRGVVAWMLGGAVAVAVVVTGGSLAANALQLHDESGRAAGIRGVSVQVTSPPAGPTAAPTTSDPLPSPSATGAATVPDPAPVVVDDHGGQSGRSGDGHGSDG